MIKDKKQSIKNYVLKLFAILTCVLPFTLSSATFIGLDIYSFILIALSITLYFIKSDSKKIMPVFVSFLLTMFVSGTIGKAATLITLILFFIISVIYFFLPKRFSGCNNSVTAGFSLATALTVTVLLTTHYFGIGANGNNVKEMIASYLSLGFHPNWRGVLYGTIVMVIMITFPRKFKKFCKIIKAPFIAIVVTLILNLFLNPPDMTSAINEIGNFSAITLPPLLGRIPVHSLAVIMIVGAWESVKWGEIKKAFSSPVSIICFAVTVFSTLYFGYIYGALISLILYTIYKLYANKSNQSA